MIGAWFSKTEQDRRIADLEARLAIIEKRLNAKGMPDQYLAQFGDHAHGWIAPDGNLGSGGLTLTSISVGPSDVVRSPSVEDAFQDYLFEYAHDGGTWAIKVKAKSPEDARARLKSLAWARYKGEVGATIPVLSLLHRLVMRLLQR